MATEVAPEAESVIEALVQEALADGLEAMTVTAVIQRALVDSGALFPEEADEIAGGIAVYLQREGKLI